MANYQVIKEAAAGFKVGTTTLEEVKQSWKPFGIYQQQGDRFMVRTRINGGQIEVTTLLGFAEVIERYGCTHAHITTRQDIQLHGVPTENVPLVVDAVDALGRPFKGGCGDTYRNTVVDARSGIDSEAPFDVYPYAEALNRASMQSEKAFNLPRKFKIGLFASSKELLRAAVHDLGFVACERDGVPGFSVYMGGGMGRESRVGICAHDFVLQTEVLRIAMAVVELFHEHGDRTNRRKARLRFVLQRLGADEFIALYQHYRQKCDALWPDIAIAPPLTLEPMDRSANFETAAVPQQSGAFKRWRQLAATATPWQGYFAVRLFVPHGNLSVAQLRQLSMLLQEIGVMEVRLLPTQDILLPRLADGLLPRLYEGLQRPGLAELDLCFHSFVGHVLSCVGATICSIGIADTPVVADMLAVALDAQEVTDDDEYVALRRLVADEVRLSGCPNSCAGHQAARLGVACFKQRVNGVLETVGKIFTGAGIVENTPRLSEPLSAEYLPLEEVVAQSVRLLRRMAAEV